VGGYARCRELPWLSTSMRGEHYADPDGFTTGARQRVAELTVTVEATTRMGPVALVGRLEYRRDQSDAHVFEAAGSRLLTHQDTSTLGLIAAF
jgi:hypothetical protein